jgi:HK97 family phage prohead protease
MADQLLDQDAFRALARSSGGAAHPAAHVFRGGIGKPKLLDETTRKVRFCFSDGSVDRMGDVIDPSGWQINTFLKNPVALWAHDSSAPPIGRASRLMVEDGRLMGDIEFATPEVYAFADTIYRLTGAGFLNAVSVGFLPLEYEFSNDDDRPWGIDFKRSELLEISVCPVPANANALIEARAKGIDTRPLIEWAERTLDGGGKMIIAKSELNRLRKAAKEPPMTVKPKRRADGMSETDPAAGGTVVATCGRSMDDECGMNDPQECVVHMTTEADESKRLAAMVRRAVKAALKDAAPKTKRPTRSRRRTDDGEDDEPRMSAEHEAGVRDAAEHLEAMGDALDDAADHHEKAMSILGSICDDLDTDPTDDDDATDQAEERSARRLRKTLAKARNIAGA